MSNKKAPEIAKLLKFNLPHGSGKRIAAECKVSNTYVYAVLGGKYYNQKILEAATRIQEETAQKRRELIERIKNTAIL